MASDMPHTLEAIRLTFRAGKLLKGKKGRRDATDTDQTSGLHVSIRFLSPHASSSDKKEKVMSDE